MSNSLFETAIEALADGFALFDPNDRLLYCNGGFSSSFAKLSAVLKPGLLWPVFVNEAERHYPDAEMQPLVNHVEQGLNERLVVELRRGGGRKVKSTLSPTAEGGFVLTESEIASTEHSHADISPALEVLHDVLDGCASRIVLIDADNGRILYRTPAWKATYGRIDDAADAFVDPLAYLDLLTEILPTGQVDDIELPMFDLHQKEFPARLSGRLIDFQNGTAIVLSAEDLTQLHQQRQQIITTNQRLVDAIEALDQGFVLFDAKHQLVASNKRFALVNRAAGIDIKPGIGNLDLIRAAEDAGHNPAAIGWAEQEQSGVDEDYEFNLAVGSLYAASRRATSDGGFVMTWRDVTRQHALEDELKKQREAVFQSEKLNALGQLLAGVAHELNNPLSVVVGHALMLQEELTDADALDSVGRISRSAERCVKIVKTFLTIARQKPVKLVRMSVDDVVGFSLDIAGYSLRNSGVTIESTVVDQLPEIMGDEDQLAQLLVNLMINAEHAIKNSVSSPRVKITTRCGESGQVEVVVSDNGPGIPDDLRARIFEPFFTTKDVGEGTGVGLALCHRIAETHNGTLSLAQSELGGATFILSLPVIDSHANALSG